MKNFEAKICKSHIYMVLRSFESSGVEFYNARKAHNLQPSKRWHFGEGRETVGNFREFDVLSAP